MFYLLLIIHLIVSAILMLVILLQSGKAGDLASTFGGATSQAAFGARGATTVLSKATTVCAVIFMLTSLGLAITYSRSTGGSIMDEAPYATEQEQEAPAEEPAAAPGESPTSGGGGTEESPPE